MKNLLPLVLPLTLACACTAAPPSADNPLTLRVGPRGGSVEADGVRVDVPAGAVDRELTITAFPKARVIDGLTTASSTWSFGPEGQTFNTPISVSLAYSGDAAHPTVWWTKEGDLTTFTKLDTTVTDGWASAVVTHFSEGAVADERCGDDEETDDDKTDDDDETDDDETDDDETDDDETDDDGEEHGACEHQDSSDDNEGDSEGDSED